jgi:cyclohexyl-isocyanide hydratase
LPTRGELCSAGGETGRIFGFQLRCRSDGNLITAGGVTSGIDFGLSVAAELAGELVAQSIQLGIEYDPAPPFNAGHPDRAPEPAIAALSSRYEKMRDLFRASLTNQILA